MAKNKKRKNVNVKKCKPKIGLTIGLKDFSLSSTNGLGQNVLTLYSMLEKTRLYDVYYLVSHGGKEEEAKELNKLITAGNKIIPVFDKVLNVKKLDLVIAIRWSFTKKEQDFLRQKNKNTKFVSLKYGNTYFTQIGNMMDLSMKDKATIPFDSEKDAVWVSPHFEDTLDWVSLIYHSASCGIAPYIWSPNFLKENIKNLNLKKEDFRKISKKRIAVLEPNLNIIKTSVIPASIVENSFRNKQDIEHCHLYAAISLKEHNTAKNIFLSFDSVKKGIMTFEEKIKFIDIFTKHSGLLLSHQHMNALNYIYLEALYLGIPFVHNSEFFKDSGYFYEGFDIVEGSKQLKKAIEEDGNFSESYKENAKKMIWKYSPENPKNILGYTALINDILGL